MACKRSGVRIPLAPRSPGQSHVVIFENHLGALANQQPARSFCLLPPGSRRRSGGYCTARCSGSATAFDLGQPNWKPIGDRAVPAQLAAISSAHWCRAAFGDSGGSSESADRETDCRFGAIGHQGTGTWAPHADDPVLRQISPADDLVASMCRIVVDRCPARFDRRPRSSLSWWTSALSRAAAIWPAGASINMRVMLSG